jgi:hypothetical protein
MWSYTEDTISQKHAASIFNVEVITVSMHMDYIGSVTLIRISGGYANKNLVCAKGKMKYHYQD